VTFPRRMAALPQLLNPPAMPLTRAYRPLSYCTTEAGAPAAPDAGFGHLHVVVALEVHRDLARTEVVVLPQVEDLADHVNVGGVGAMVRSTR
jgi:hypothetical protein